MGRSAVTNGKVLHSNATEIDGRGHGARRFRDLIAAFSSGLGELSESDTAMVRTAAALTLKSEQMQADLAAGKEVDATTLIKLAGATRRSLAAISAKAKDKPAGPTLAEYWASKQAAADDTDEED
jgi:hypothetical protein